MIEKPDMTPHQQMLFEAISVAVDMLNISSSEAAPVFEWWTEWVEAVEASEGRMVVVGLDAAKAAAELDRLAPATEAEALAADRAARLALPPAGAAEAIATTLAATEA